MTHPVCMYIMITSGLCDFSTDKVLEHKYNSHPQGTKYHSYTTIFGVNKITNVSRGPRSKNSDILTGALY